MDQPLHPASDADPERGRLLDSTDPREPELVRLRSRLAEVERRLVAAETLNAARIEFLGRVSHELRTPLNAIGGYVDLLLQGIHGELSEGQESALHRIRTVQHLLITLIGDLLSYTRLESGRIECRPEDIDLAPLVREVRDVIVAQAAARSIVLETRCPGTLRVRADPERLGQILLNLLSNALKFTPPGGRVCVEALRLEDDPLRIAIAVRDSGCGIAPADVERIFQAFIQLEQAIVGQGAERGLGLGLAISRDLVRRMDGEIRVESEPGRGSTFSVVLPRAGPSAGASGVSPRRTSRGAGRPPRPRRPREPRT